MKMSMHGCLALLVVVGSASAAAAADGFDARQMPLRQQLEQIDAFRQAALIDGDLQQLDWAEKLRQQAIDHFARRPDPLAAPADDLPAAPRSTVTLDESPTAVDHQAADILNWPTLEAGRKELGGSVWEHPLLDFGVVDETEAAALIESLLADESSNILPLPGFGEYTTGRLDGFPRMAQLPDAAADATDDDALLFDSEGPYSSGPDSLSPPLTPLR